MKRFSQVTLSVLFAAVACQALASPPQVIVKVSGSLLTEIEQVGGGHPSATQPFTHFGLTGPVSETLQLTASPHPIAGHVIDWHYKSREYKNYPNELEFSYSPFIYGSGAFGSLHGDCKRIEAATHGVITVYVLAPKHRTVQLFGVARGFQSVSSTACSWAQASNTFSEHAPWSVFNNGSGWENFLIFDGNYQSSGSQATIGGYTYYAVHSFSFDSSCDGQYNTGPGSAGTFTGQAEWSIRIHATVLN